MKTKILLSFLLTGLYFGYSQNPNETCANAEILTITTTSQTVNLDLNQAIFTNQNGCDSNDIDTYTNYWYEFTMPANSNLYINVTINNNAEIYDACNGNQLYCFTTNKLITDLVGGQIYKLRVFRAQSQGNTRPYFYINSYDKITNDDCANAEMLPTLTSENTQIQFQLAGATLNTEETCLGSMDFIADAWWQFTMPVTGNLFVDTPNGIVIYDACNGNELYCNASEASTDSFKLIDNLTQGNSYLLRFFSTEQHIFEAEFQSLNIRVYERAINDECVDAVVIPTITTTPQEVTFDTFGSLINFEESCVGLPQEDFVDVWFEFTMPNNSYLNFDSYQFNFFSIYDACNGNEIACFAGVEQVSGLTPNQTYILRVFQRQTEMFHPNKFFNIYGTETLGFEEQSQESSISMYPNPVNDYLNISVKNNQTIESIECYDILGKQIFSKPFNSQINVSNLESGLYLLKIKTNRGNLTKKIFIE